jgi:seryl-tRNA(Sec) selenium transferase
VSGAVANVVEGSWAVAAVADDAAVGGGSLSTVAVPSWAVALRGPDERAATRLARAMRLLPVPLFARVRGDEVRVNMTTILPPEDDELVRAIVAAMESVR